jgi:hypothetical protein
MSHPTLRPRRLKIEAVGDFAQQRSFPRIRLKGHWLKAAGFPADAYVLVSNPQPGTLTLQILENESTNSNSQTNQQGA